MTSPKDCGTVPEQSPLCGCDRPAVFVLHVGDRARLLCRDCCVAVQRALARNGVDHWREPVG